MENYIIKVTIENVSGKVIKESTFETNKIIEGDVIDNFINTTLSEIRDERRDNPHHHQNRLD